MLTIQEMLNGISDVNEDVLVKISDKLWKIGSLNEIKEKTDADLFLLHIGVNMIGNWKCEGWWCLICEQAELVPYIPGALEAFGLLDLKTAFENIIAAFPAFTVFSNSDNTYYDIVNFLQNVHFKVSDERLNSIAPEKRKQMVKYIEQELNTLEELTEPLWGYDAECEGWKQVLDFIEAKA